MGEKSGVTSPEHVRCSGGKTVCGCKARTQTTRDGTARYGWGKEEAVCEGWNHDRSIAASRAFGNGIRRILFGGRTGSVQIRHNAIHYEATGYTACPYSKEKSRPTELPSCGLPIHRKPWEGEGRLGRADPSPEGAPPLNLLFNAKFVLPQLVEDSAHGDRHHAGKERDPLFGEGFEGPFADQPLVKQ